MAHLYIVGIVVSEKIIIEFVDIKKKCIFAVRLEVIPTDDSTDSSRTGSMFHIGLQFYIGAAILYLSSPIIPEYQYLP